MCCVVALGRVSRIQSKGSVTILQKKHEIQNEPVVEEVACTFDWADVYSTDESVRQTTPSAVKRRLLIWVGNSVCGLN